MEYNPSSILRAFKKRGMDQGRGRVRWGHEPPAWKGIYRQPEEQGQVSSLDRGRSHVIRRAL